MHSCEWVSSPAVIETAGQRGLCHAPVHCAMTGGTCSLEAAAVHISMTTGAIIEIRFFE
jgi:hypothetical protein